MTSRSNKQVPPNWFTCMYVRCLYVCVCVFGGVVRGRGHGGGGGGGSPAFCHGTLDKTKTTHFSGPLPHLVFRNKSGLWLQGPDNTSSLPLSPALSWVLWWWRLRAEGGALSRQTLPYERKASAAANPPLLPPSTSTTPLLFFRRISQLFLDGRAKPSKDLHWRYVIKTQPSPHAVINIKIKKWSAAKMGSEWINERMNEWRLFISYWIFI